jgi:hypothetical protein
MILRPTQLGAALAAMVLMAAMPAHAAGPMIDWDPAFFFDPASTPTSSPPGSELKIVGTISHFDDVLADLNANLPGFEYTFYAAGLISTGTVAVGPPATTFYTTTYVGGTIDIYEDTTPDATFDPNPPNDSVPSTFQNGTLILSGSFTSFVTQTNNFTAFDTGNAEGTIQWTGGTLVERVQECPGLFNGGLTWLPSLLIPGYLFRHDGKVDRNCPTPEQGSTWGTIKKLYR